ncbi:MAG: GpE family phage tail protein [Comamonadaceae bacterium]|nr:MAG: GpE family phage tail protein [Comamonadaceae bacterium]
MADVAYLLHWPPESMDVMDPAELGRWRNPLKRMLGGTTAAARGVKDLRDKLKELNAQQAAVGNVKKQSEEYARLNNQLKIRNVMLDGLRAGGNASAATLKREEGAVRKLREALDQQRVVAGKARIALNAMGVGGSVTAAQDRLRGSIEQTNAALEKQRERFNKLSLAQRQAGHMAARGAAVSAAGMGMLYGGRRATMAAGGVMGEGKHAASEGVRIQALGLGADESAKAIKFAENFKSYGTSRLDNLELMRDAITVFNDRHHAEEAMPILASMKFANEATFGSEEGGENSRKFMDMMKVIEMRGGANNTVDFERNANMVQQVITATGGRVGASDWMDVIKRGKLAATGFDEKEFFYRLEPLVQEMGGNTVGTGLTAAYQNLYQGRTTKRAALNLEKFGLIGDYSKVKHDKVGQTSQLNPGALKGAEVFRRSQFEWMETVLLPALRSKGVVSEQETIDAIGSIFSNTNGGALMAKMYQQRAMVQKGYELNSKAANINQLKALAQDSPVGKEVELAKRAADLKMELSNTAMPAYVKLLEMLTGLTRGVSNFAKEHPTLTKALVYTAGAAALGATALGALAIPVGLLMAKGAVLRFLLAKIGVQFSLTAAASRVAAPAMNLMARAWAWGGGALARLGPWLLRGAQWLGAWGSALASYLPAVLRWGMVLLRVATGPVGLLALAATMLYSRWADVVGGFNLLMADIGAGFSRLAQAAMDLVPRFFEAGAAIVQGMANGITSRITAVRDAISMAAGDSVDWFKEKLDIHSPSRVFMQLGGYVSEGAALGIQQGAGMVRTAAVGMAAATMGPMAAVGAPAAPVGGAAMGGSTYQITIQAAPGMDPQAIARAVSAELDRRERERDSRRLSRLSDID